MAGHEKRNPHSSRVDVRRLIRDIEAARLELQRRAYTARSVAVQKAILDLVTVPGDLLHPGIVGALEQPSETEDHRGARLSWIGWAEGYVRTLREAVATLDETHMAGDVALAGASRHRT
jgi:hypothetical protein